MKCPNCGGEMEGGYRLHPGLGGVLRVVKMEMKPDVPSPSVSVCPKCGKVEMYLDRELLAERDRPMW